MQSNFLPYETPNTVQLLTLGSFLILLPTIKIVFQRVLSAGLLGPLLLGLIYGAPLTDILAREWQQAFLALGYLGFILLIYEGGLATRLDLLRANLLLSLTCGLVGVGASMALSLAFLHYALGYPLSEAFVLGAALSATSLGTTFSLLQDLNHTRIGTIIMSAAMIDDVIGLIMASVVSSLGDTSGSRTSLGWVIGRPIMAAGLLTLVFPSFTRLALRPIYMRYLRAAAHRFSPHDHTAVTILAIAGLCSAAAYAGTSILYGAYLAGASLAYLDTNTATPSSPSSSSISERATFQAVFHRVIAPVQHALLEPLFFASIGFAIPIRRAWHGTIVWQGVVYALLMGAAKLLVGACVPVWVVAARVFRAPPQRVRETLRPTAILGAAMVARGEIGLLVLELGYVQAARVSERGFLVGLWAVVLNTLLGPIVTGALMHRMGEQVRKGPWGDVKRDQ